MKLSVIAFLSLILFYGCKTVHVVFPPPVLEFTDLTSFCDLLNHKNELVYTRGIYSGTKDSWHLHAEDDSCKALSANVYWSDDALKNPGFLKLIRKIRNKDNSCSLIVDAIGYFEDDRSGDRHGLGDLGTYHYKFVVKWIVNIQKRQTKKIVTGL